MDFENGKSAAGLPRLQKLSMANTQANQAVKSFLQTFLFLLCFIAVGAVAWLATK